MAKWLRIIRREVETQLVKHWIWTHTTAEEGRAAVRRLLAALE